MALVEQIVAHYNHWVTIFLMVSGLYIVVARGNMVKKLVGLALFQTSVYLLYITPGKILGERLRAAGHAGKGRDLRAQTLRFLEHLMTGAEAVGRVDRVCQRPSVRAIGGGPEYRQPVAVLYRRSIGVS